MALGERAGNAALEEIVMAVHTRQDVFPVFNTRIDTTQIVCSLEDGFRNYRFPGTAQ
jgi:isopropylmalate/homocitrate/citramalate synthase